ncbi:hypothetical protein LJC22_06590 [Desulfosarcina sp. OttesenSCG-928-G10]|nr:hypothetical protein [Desulfosarcina sp. OttesenSCG-928-G10]MDL2320733.1 hypothetical protein [Desulfosarcina sp. OttesenSCG-928-B08]
MTAIHPDKLIQGAELLQKPHPAEDSRNMAFDAVLRPMIQSTEQTEPQTQISDPAGALSDIRPARFFPASESTPATVMEKVDQVLDTLDVYQQKLEDETASLKDMDPILETLISRNESLKTMADALRPEDDALKSIVNASLSLSAMEIARFRSGDYNSG